MMEKDDESISEIFSSDRSLSEGESTSSSETIILSSKEDYLDRLIELAVDAYQRRYDAGLSLQLSELDESMSLIEVNKLQIKERWALLHYQAAFVQFESIYIQEAFFEKDAIVRANAIFNDYSAVDDPVGFEGYMLEYCVNHFGYSLLVELDGLSSNTMAVSTPIASKSDSIQNDLSTGRTDTELSPVVISTRAFRLFENDVSSAKEAVATSLKTMGL